jgi:hypothetical protein
MTTDTPDTLLEKVEVHLCGPGTNYREMISAEQRLVLTAIPRSTSIINKKTEISKLNEISDQNRI